LTRWAKRDIIEKKMEEKENAFNDVILARCLPVRTYTSRFLYYEIGKRRFMAMGNRLHSRLHFRRVFIQPRNSIVLSTLIKGKERKEKYGEENKGTT
jgi:hypothetical protein